MYKHTCLYFQPSKGTWGECHLYKTDREITLPKITRVKNGANKLCV